MNKKTIGVIGLGSIGLRHAKNLKAMGHNVRAYDTDMKRRLMFDGVLYEMDEILDSDAIVIASPTTFHKEHIANVAAVYKPIFVEKPIVASQQDYDFLLPSLWADGLSIIKMVGYNLAFHSCVKKAKEWLDAGHIGKPLWGNFVCAQYNDRPAYLRDGVTLNWSHEIYLSLYLLGPGSVSGSSTRISDGKDDLTDILLTHENGCRSTIHLDYITQPEIRQSMIVGENATIIMDLVSRNAWLRGADGVIWDHLEGQDSWEENYVDEMKAFIQRIDGKQTIGATGQEGLDVLKICLKVREQAGLK